MNRIVPQRCLLALALVSVLVLGAVPAYAATTAAVHPDPVPSHALVGTVDLFGLSDPAARAAIASASSVATFAPITVKGDGRSKTFAAKSALSLNVDATLDLAYSRVDTVTPFALVPVYSIKPTVVTGWYTALAKLINHDAVNAKRRVRGHRLIVSREWEGHKVNRLTTIARINAALNSEIASPGIKPAAVSASLRTLVPKVTRKNIPKAILVVLSEYRIKLYKGLKVEKTYRCAIGMPGFSTPTGKWKVTRKVKNPSWYNPGSPWAANMPSVIGPGPTNPLGTRAIYLSAPGIRFHGTYKWWSIGHRASHGCMRMKRRDVEDFFPRVPVGTTVWIVK